MILLLKNEKSLFISMLVLIALFPLEPLILSSNIFNTIALTLIISVIMYSALNVAHHAEMLAEKYGEPYGTMILTLSAVLVEVLMIGIMMSHSDNLNLARDTIVSAVILDINGLFGLAAIIGGIKHGEQDFNFDSTNSYVSMLIVAIGIAMVSPIFITFNPLIMALLFIFMFVVFTRIQTKEHSYFFKYDYKKNTKVSATDEHEDHNENINGLYHISILGGSIVVIGFLSELLSVFMDVGLKSSGLPIVLGAFAVAVISAAPELFTAIKSASENRMQTVINIALGASLATVLLTIPAMIILSTVLGHEINFALSNIQMVLLGMTLLASMIHFSDGQSNVLEGSIHFTIFLVFIYVMITGQLG